MLKNLDDLKFVELVNKDEWASSYQDTSGSQPIFKYEDEFYRLTKSVGSYSENSNFLEKVQQKTKTITYYE